MAKIDGELVAKEVSKCGKRLQVSVSAGLLAEAMKTLEDKNPIVMATKEKCGDQLYGAFAHTLLTFFALNLLAKTHNTKEFKEIMSKVQVEDEIIN